MLRVPFVVFFLILAGCASRSGLEEFTLYKRAFDESLAVATALIDRLAASERQVGRLGHFEPNKLGVDPVFKPEDAAYFSNHTDPPLAAEYRRAIVVINRYNELMLAFASGKGFDKAIEQLNMLASEATLFAAPVGQTPVSAGYRAIANDILTLVAAERSREVFQASFRKTAPQLLILIDGMKAQTPVAFKNLAFFLEADLLNIDRGLRAGDVAALKAKHMELRVLLSDWVILLDQHAALIKATQMAIENPRLGTELSGATEAVVQLRVTVDSVRSHLASIRTQ